MATNYLLKLAALLEKHRDNGVRFDLSKWYQKSYWPHLRVGDPLYKKDPDWCGTQACACGLAALNPAFKKAGFREENSVIIFTDPVDGYEYEAWAAVRHFFGIEYDEAEYLFSSASYTGKTYGAAAARKVAKRIRAFVKRGNIIPTNWREPA